MKDNMGTIFHFMEMGKVVVSNMITTNADSIYVRICMSTSKHSPNLLPIA